MSNFLLKAHYTQILSKADHHLEVKPKKIKSHHNVGGLPKKMNSKLIEPLKEFFKDEVRVLGTSLGLKKKYMF